jgi:hypothetical protein
MPIKRKSLAVVVISGFIISSVLVLTLVGYSMYMELKDREAKLAYEHDLEQVKAKLKAHGSQ